MTTTPAQPSYRIRMSCNSWYVYLYADMTVAQPTGEIGPFWSIHEANGAATATGLPDGDKPHLLENVV